ncbi:MAG: succinyl-diaminopimelate desuccinylase [Polyangiaceae bacterium]|jgi:succinyl-diaminopimelate desuccinylase
MTVADLLLDETLVWLCSVASPIGEERALCDAVEERLRGDGFGSEMVRLSNSLVVPAVRQGRGPHVVLAGHLDTVRAENGPARIEGDRCFGSGASDMKSGLALMLVLVEELGSKLPCDLTLVIYAREEGPYAENELGVVLDARPELGHADVVVALEPSDNELRLGCVGSIHATVTFRGTTAHSARPGAGDNAITKASEFLAEMRALPPRPSEIDGLTYWNVTSVTKAWDGGRGKNVVPDLFMLNVNHRFAADTSPEDACSFVRSLVGDRAAVDFTDLAPAAPPSANSPLVRALRAAGVRGVHPMQAWTDVARFAALGVPAVNFGPGEFAQAHCKDESTSLALLHEGYDVFVRWLQSLR